MIEGECSNFCTRVRDQRRREVHFHSTLRVQKSDSGERRTEALGTSLTINTADVLYYLCTTPMR